MTPSTNTPRAKKKVFIIGAGPSGLVALKEMLEAGLDALCVDTKKKIGGLFSVSYDELYTTTTNMLLAFSDFSPKENLKRYIKLINTAVKRWNILTKDWLSKPGELRRDSITFSNDLPDLFDNSADQKRASTVFRKNAAPAFIYDTDYLIVVSGTNQVPRIPEFPNCNAEIIHSADFTNAAFICEGKKVLVVGNGESASDVASQLTDAAEKVTLFSRRDFDPAPRFISKFLEDGAYNERQVLEDQDGHPLRPYGMLEGITNSRVLIRWGSCPVACKGLDIIVSPEVVFVRDGDVARFRDVSFMGKDEQHMNQADAEMDVVILCTEFELNFDWIDIGKNPIEANHRKWLKHCFPPNHGDKVAFLGYARPTQGGIPQCSELLDCYVALLLKGERSLPKDYTIQGIKEGMLEKATFYATPNANALV